MKTSFTIAGLGLLVAGCGAGGPGEPPATDEPAPPAPTAPAPPAPPAPMAPAEPGPPLLAEQPDPLPEPSARCAKVDFLYVVDNSASMTGKQHNLARSFAGFRRVVEQTLDTTDHQIMVIDTDSSNVGDILNGLQSGGDRCDGMLGVGLRMSGEGESCGLAGMRRFLRADQRHAADTFACIARVGTLGDASERPIDALLAATGATASGAASCNEGFLRDDAILVVTLISDEEDDSSLGEPADWKRRLLQVKGGDEDAVVMLGLIGDLHVPGGLPGGPCDALSGSEAPRLHEFVQSFELGSLGSVCASDYSAFFERAVSPIDTACEAFEPILH